MMKKLFLTFLFGSVLTFIVNHTMAQPVHTPPANAVPMQLTQVPGYYRIMLGDFEVTALYDGAASLDSKLFSNYSKLSKEKLDSLIEHSHSPKTQTGGVDTAIIAFLVNTGDHLILIDAGKGEVEDAIFVDKKGLLLSSLEAAGYKAEQIDVILPTHMHADHFSGVTVNGKKVFPNATIYLSNQEKAFWLDTPDEKIPANAKPFVNWAREAAAPYLASGQIKYYNSGDEVIAGVKSIPLQGHTLGHNGFEFYSKGQEMLVWGDLMHSHAIQMKHPEVAVDFDANPIAARKSRLNALPNLAKRGVLIAGAHLPFPGLGYLRTDKNGGYRWVPVEYTLIRR